VQPFDEECDCVNTPIELGSLNISNEVYDKDSWDGVTDIAPSKNAVRDIVEQLTGNSGGGGVWGAITGTLSDQTDLQSELDLKEDLSNKSDSYTASSTTTYPNTKALVDGLENQKSEILNYNFLLGGM